MDNPRVLLWRRLGCLVPFHLIVGGVIVSVLPFNIYINILIAIVVIAISLGGIMFATRRDYNAMRPELRQRQRRKKRIS